MVTATSDNKAYLASADAFAQIPRFARNFRYAQPLSDIQSINNGDNQVYAIKEVLKWKNTK